jgi:fumarate reductase flavoprotein subunit
MLQKRVGGRVKIADSWDEIAAWMGILPQILRATIDEYNSFCDKGHDDMFLKEPNYLVALRTPPYYAIRCVPRYNATFGGVRINYKTEALDHEYNPIPGLYASGCDAGGYHGECYNILLNGSQVGFAVNSGRIAGENAAEYVLRK